MATGPVWRLWLAAGDACRRSLMPARVTGLATAAPPLGLPAHVRPPPVVCLGRLALPPRHRAEALAAACCCDLNACGRDLSARSEYGCRGISHSPHSDDCFPRRTQWIAPSGSLAVLRAVSAVTCREIAPARFGGARAAHPRGRRQQGGKSSGVAFLV